MDGSNLITGNPYPIDECGFDETREILWVQASAPYRRLVGYNMTAIYSGASGVVTVGQGFSLDHCVSSTSDSVDSIVISGDILAISCASSVAYVDLALPQSAWMLRSQPVFGPQNLYAVLSVPDTDRWYFPTTTGIEYWRFGIGTSPRLAASSIGSTTTPISTDSFGINPSSATLYWLGQPEDSQVVLNQLGSSESAFTATPPVIASVEIPYPAGTSSLNVPTFQYVGIDATVNRHFTLFLTTSFNRGNFSLASVGFGQCNSSATSCESCLSGGDLECGWCPTSDGLSGTCGTASECSGTQWFQDKCPALTSATSLDPLVTGLPFVLQIDATPFLGANASCFLLSQTNNERIGIPVITAAEPLCGISSSTDTTLRKLAGNYTLEVVIDGSFTLPRPVPVSFLNCSALTTCKSCTSQGSSCDWCVYDGACVNQATDCSRSGPSSQRPQVPGACPVQGPANPNSTLTPPRPQETVTVTATNLVTPPTGAGSIYTCSFSLPTLISPVVSAARFNASTPSVECNLPTPPNNAIGSGSLSIQLNGHQFADNSSPFTFYDCSSPLLQTCDTCLAASNTMCSWNAASGSCGLTSTCTSPTDCRTSCPSILSVNQTSFHVTDDIGATISITGTYFTSASGTWTCDFDFASTTATRVSETEIRCAVPTFTNATYFTGLRTSYLANLTLELSGKSYAHPVPMNWYSCGGSTCALCLNNNTAPKCRWDFNDFTCGNAAALPSGVSQCPLIATMSDTFGHIAGDLDLIITPSATAPTSLAYRCAWTDFSVSGVPMQTANATLVGNTWTCTTPDILSAVGSAPSSPITTNFWIEAQISAGDWKPYTALPVKFTFYNCLAASNCSVCLSSSQCVWGSYQNCGPVSSPPSGDIISGKCPHLTSITPALQAATTDVIVTVTADFMPASADWTSYSCLWALTNGATIRSAVTKVNATTLTCPFTRTYRDLNFDTLSFSLVAGYLNVADNSLSFEVYNCPQASDCAECTQIHPMCGWCPELGTCGAQSSCNSWTTTDCPYVESVVPPYAAIGSSSATQITFTGSFNASSLNVVCLFTYPSGETSNVTASSSGNQLICELPIVNETTSLTIELGHMVASVTAKKRSLASSFFADPEFPRTIKRATLDTFTRLVPDIFTFDFFSCQSADGSAPENCSSCVTNPSRDSRCGWCSYDSTCSDSYSCNPTYSSFAGSASTCPAITAVSPSTGPLKGGTVVTVRGSVFFNGTDGTQCRFGNQVVNATVLDSNSLRCPTPAASLLGITKSGRSAPISILWRGKIFTPTTSGFSFTYRNDDTSTKIAIGVTVGVCLFLILVFLIVLILCYKRIKAYHNRRRFLKLQEPDYYSIATTQTTTLDLIVTPSDIKALASFVKLLEADTTFSIAHAMGASVQTSQSDNLARSIVFFYQSRGRVLDLLLSFIAAEIRVSEHEGTLFRASSFACKLFTQYARYNGLKYLWLTLGYYINQLAEFAREERAEDREGILGPGNMEVDPDRWADESGLPSDIDIRLNQYELLTRTSKVLKNIFASTNQMSPQLRQLFAYVKQEVAAKFPDNNADYKAVGGFVFLRLLCPAIVAPHVYGLLSTSPNETAQRYFVLIAKTLQNLANETLPGTNEEFMVRMNEFITKNIHPLHTWIDELCDNPDTSDASTGKETAVPDSTVNASVACMQNVVVNEWDLVSKKLPDDTVASLERTIERGPIGKKPNKKKGDNPPRRR